MFRGLQSRAVKRGREQIARRVVDGGEHPAAHIAVWDPQILEQVPQPFENRTSNLLVHDVRHPPAPPATVCARFRQLLGVAIEKVAAKLTGAVENRGMVATRCQHAERFAKQGSDVDVAQANAQRLSREGAQLPIIECRCHMREHDDHAIRQEFRMPSVGEPCRHSLGDIKGAQPCHEEFFGQEVTLEKNPKPLPDTILVSRKNGRMRDGQTERTTKQRGYGEPIR